MSWSFDIGMVVRVHLLRLTKNKTMNDFISRLHDERNELREKVNKLEDFLFSEDDYNGIGDVQVSLLKVQLYAMKTYWKCLIERIADLNK